MAQVTHMPLRLALRMSPSFTHSPILVVVVIWQVKQQSGEPVSFFFPF